MTAFGQLNDTGWRGAGIAVFVNPETANKMNAYRLHPLYPSADLDGATNWFYLRAGYSPPSALPFGSGGSVQKTTGWLFP